MKHLASLRNAGAAAMLALAGCSSLQHDQRKEAMPSREAGYATASFSHGATTLPFSFGIVDAASGRKYWMPFAGKAPTLDQFAMLTLPPGHYRLTSWGNGQAVPGRQKNLPHPRDFTVRSGQVTYIGRFIAKSEFDSGLYVDPLQEVGVSLAAAHKAFVEAFPGFATAPFTCGPCRR